MNETDADMGAVTESPGDAGRPWTVIVAAGMFRLVAAGLAASGVWGVTRIIAGEVDSVGGAAGVSVLAWLLAAYYWFIGRRLMQARDIIAQGLFQALLWLPVGYYLREAAQDGYGLAAWGLAAAMAALLLAPPTRRAVGFGDGRPPFAADD